MNSFAVMSGFVTNSCIRLPTLALVIVSFREMMASNDGTLAGLMENARSSCSSDGSRCQEGNFFWTIRSAS